MARRTTRRRPPKKPSLHTPTPLHALNHDALQLLPKVTRDRLKWLAETLDVGEVAVVSLAVATLFDDWYEPPTSG